MIKFFVKNINDRSKKGFILKCSKRLFFIEFRMRGLEFYIDDTKPKLNFFPFFFEHFCRFKSVLGYMELLGGLGIIVLMSSQSKAASCTTKL